MRVLPLPVAEQRLQHERRRLPARATFLTMCLYQRIWSAILSSVVLRVGLGLPRRRDVMVGLDPDADRLHRHHHLVRRSELIDGPATR
jgi:hypothetical protein